MTAQQDPEIVPFSKFIGALDPWLEQVVLIGGWAHRLYRLDSRARNLKYPPLTTLDGDVAVPTKLKVEESNVRKRLLEAGFYEELRTTQCAKTTKIGGTLRVGRLGLGAFDLGRRLSS